MKRRTILPAGLLALSIALALPAVADMGATSLTGSWTLVAADVIHPDGTRGHDYGDAPKGLLIVDAKGRYSLQIYDSRRSHYASGDRDRGTPDEYKANALGISTHFGMLHVDGDTMTLDVDSASFPNQDGKQQKRMFKLDGDELSYRVQARPNGDVPVSVWRRLK
jgi:hypothetical protein